MNTCSVILNMKKSSAIKRWFFFMCIFHILQYSINSVIHFILFSILWSLFDFTHRHFQKSYFLKINQKKQKLGRHKKQQSHFYTFCKRRSNTKKWCNASSNNTVIKKSKKKKESANNKSGNQSNQKN